jgi:hypothetical protein
MSLSRWQKLSAANSGNAVDEVFGAAGGATATGGVGGDMGWREGVDGTVHRNLLR